jgi:hypothetical protein
MGEGGLTVYTFRPAVRENTPLIIGIGGPTKSGKTFSALRLATGLANGGAIAMLNAEGPRGHQYADTFKYVACELVPPYRPTAYTEALEAAAAINPAVVIIDSASHMHDGPGGVLEWHEEELDRMAGTDRGKRERATFAAWVKPKAAENQFIYAMLGMKIPVILCLRAKEKLKLVKGQDPIDLGWQPIVGERVAFETIFTLMLPPYSQGVPDLAISFMRAPFDTMVPKGEPVNEALGQKLAAWARGTTTPTRATGSAAGASDEARPLLAEIQGLITRFLPGQNEASKKAKAQVVERVFNVKGWSAVEALPVERLQAALAQPDLTSPSRLEAACADFAAKVDAA